LSQCVGHDLNYIILQLFAKGLSQCVGHDLSYISSQVFAKKGWVETQKGWLRITVMHNCNWHVFYDYQRRKKLQ